MKLFDLYVVIASHEFTTGPAQNFEEYCRLQKVKRLLFLSHPLYYPDPKGDGWRYYENGKKKEEKYRLSNLRFSSINYIKEVLQNILWTLKSDIIWDLFVGSDCLNAISGIVLKKIGRVKKVVYYSIDYVPHRFKSNFLNYIYHKVDIFCVKHSDITWDLSPRMREAREKYGHLSPKYKSKQVLVPEGVWFDRIKRYPLDEIDKNKLIYSGHLAKRLGVQKVIEAIPIIIRTLPRFKFVITGKGDYRKFLENLIRKLGISRYVIFKGFIKSHKQLERIIAKCAIGIAPYSDEESSFSYYCDPSKTKVYMGCGLPVIMTDVFYNAREIKEKGAGVIVNYDSKDIAREIVILMINPQKLKKYKNAAIDYIKQFDWNSIFYHELNRLLNT